jgi:hypothetical protein
MKVKWGEKKIENSAANDVHCRTKGFVDGNRLFQHKRYHQRGSQKSSFKSAFMMELRQHFIL